jgi:hypothetical protein
VLHEHRELVAAEPGQRVSGAQPVAEPLPDRTSSASPTACPSESLTALKPSRSRKATETGRWSRPASDERDVGQEPGPQCRSSGPDRVRRRPVDAGEQGARADQAESEPPSPCEARAAPEAAVGQLVGEDVVGHRHQQHTGAEQDPATQLVSELADGEHHDRHQHHVAQRVVQQHHVSQHSGRRCLDHDAEPGHPGDQAERTADHEPVQHPPRPALQRRRGTEPAQPESGRDREGEIPQLDR